MAASGLCHSDDHVATGDLPAGIFPMAGGHEGAGVVTKVGPNTPGFAEGDHVVFSFLPGCGRCRWCATGHQNLCDSVPPHAVEWIEEAGELARSFTNGHGADSAIVTVGVTTGDHVAAAFATVRKQGTCVVTGLGNIADTGVNIPLGELTLFQKRLQGSLFGESAPSFDIPRQLELYRTGALKPDELVTTTYTLDEVNQGYEDMHAGKNIRGVIHYT